MQVGLKAPVGNLGQGLFSGAAVPYQPAADNGAGAPDACEAVDVDFFALVQASVYHVENLLHLLPALGDVPVLDGKVVELRGQVLGARSPFPATSSCMREAHPSR